MEDSGRSIKGVGSLMQTWIHCALPEKAGSQQSDIGLLRVRGRFRRKRDRLADEFR